MSGELGYGSQSIEKARAHDVYQVHPLLYPALPKDRKIHPKSPAAASISLRCAEGHDRNLYLGSSDGFIHHYILKDEGSSQEPDQMRLVASKQVSAAGKPIERLLVLHRIGLAAVVAESTLTFLHLPNLDNVPTRLLPAIRGVLTVVLDDAEMKDGGVDGEGFVSLCIIKKRMAILAKVGMGKWIHIKEVPVPGGTILARRFGDHLCTATTSEYSLVNLTSGQTIPLGLPISHSNEAPSASTRPSMLSCSGAGKAADCEFLITSHSEDQSLGVFVQTNGEPSPKLIEWESHPRALFQEWPYLISLLRDDTIQVHHLETMERQQTIQLPELLEPRLLSSGVSKLNIHVQTANSPADLVAYIDVAAQKRPTSNDVGESAGLESFQDFSPTLRHRSWQTLAANAVSSPGATALLACRDAVQCLVHPTPLSDAVALIARGRWAALSNLADSLWSSASSDINLSHDAVKPIYALIAFRRLSILDFAGVVDPFLRSNLDIRLLLRLFPGLWEVQTTQVPVFGALQTLTEQWITIENSIAGNLEWLYSPYAQSQDNEEVQALQRQLQSRAYDMIAAVLQAKRREGNLEASLAGTVDIALAQLFAIRGSRSEFSALLVEVSDSADMAQIEAAGRSLGALAALGEFFFSRSEWSKTLDIWTALIEGHNSDPEFSRGVSDVVALLFDHCDAALQQQYAFWTVKHDTQAGVKLLAQGSGAIPALESRGVEGADPRKIIDQLSAAGAHQAAESFLEQIVVGHKKQDAQLHNEFIQRLLTRVQATLRDPSTRSLFAAAQEDYRHGGYAESFMGHLALLGADEMISKAVLERLKFMVLLQASRAGDVSAIADKLEQDDQLAYEHAIVAGRLGQDRKALQLLAIGLHDANSAEAYCSQGGLVLSPWVVEQTISSLSEDASNALRPYAKMLSRSTRSKKTAADIKDRLIKELLEVYMGAGSETGQSQDSAVRVHATAHLLNTQALHLSILDVLPLVPSEWPLSTLRTFLSRNLRRESHHRHVGSLTRALALSHSLEKSEETWAALRAMGGVIQDGDDEQAGGDGRDTDEVGHEKPFNSGFDEKVIPVAEKPSVTGDEGVDDRVADVRLDSETLTRKQGDQTNSMYKI